jgi:RNA polymerase sigma-70 factor (ECF subfamily)
MVQSIEEQLHGLFVAGLSGDSSAYRSFLDQLSRHLRGFLAHRLYGWPDDVEDIVQECLLAVHNQRYTYETDQPLTAWVHAIARYKMVDLLRAKGAREALHEPINDDMELFAHCQIEAGQARRDLGVLLQTLPDHHRIPIEHVKIQGLSISEAATLTGLSESAIKVGIHRGLKTLASKIRACS